MFNCSNLPIYCWSFCFLILVVLFLFLFLLLLLLLLLLLWIKRNLTLLRMRIHVVGVRVARGSVCRAWLVVHAVEVFLHRLLEQMVSVNVLVAFLRTHASIRGSTTWLASLEVARIRRILAWSYRVASHLGRPFCRIGG